MGALARDEDGAALVYVSVSAALLLGMVGLALDGSRSMISHSEAQAAADAAALAAASQLDGKPTAIARATAAAQGAPLVANSQRFASGSDQGGVVTITEILFLRALPPNDSTPLTNGACAGGCFTTDPAQARFASVKTEQLTHTTTLLRAISTQGTAQMRGKAVAGFRELYCKIPPLMICNPDETTPGAPFLASARIGAEVRAKMQSGNTQWSPGLFGLLQSPECSTNSAACLRKALAEVTPNGCFETTINPLPGQQAGPAAAGMNTRFGIYQQPLSSSDQSMPPDTNVTQDFQGCTSGNVSAGAALPHDTNVASGSTLPRIGNGVWDCRSYWLANHTQAVPAGCTTTSSAATGMTRYAVYQMERSTQPSRYGRSACNLPPLDERRLVHMVVINCRADAPSPTSTNVPVQALLKAFLLRPVDGSSQEMDLEIVDVARPGVDNAVIKDDVQLYR